ncbi:MAG: hypothetical protein KF764_08685 [Labilithrix sp.]|nr:hypothetical protein [Labilithrix sp.]
MIALCICGECLLEGQAFCSEPCATTVREAKDQAASIDELMARLALVDAQTDELERLRRENELLLDLESACADYLAIAIDAGAALAMKNNRALYALRAVAEVRTRMVAAVAALRRMRGVSPTLPAPMRAA